MSIKSLENQIQKTLAQSHFMASVAAKVRNQCNCIIGYQLGETSHSDKNGEYRVLSVLAPHCKTFVDVGANIGNWTEGFLKENSKAQGWLYEPSRQCASQLESRFAENQITVRNLAVSDFIGRTAFAEEANCGEGSSIKETYVQQALVHEREVEVTTLDAEFGDTHTVIDFLKIDTEGYDLKVLQGAKNMLVQQRVRFVQFEYNTHWIYTGSSLYNAFEYLRGYGFSCFLIRSTGLHPFDYPLWGDFFRYSNFLAVKKDDLEICQRMVRNTV